MKVLVSGAGGLVGGALVDDLSARRMQILRLSRTPDRAGAPTVVWDPLAGILDGGALAGVDAVVHLAGESIQGRWTAAKKARIRDSRVQGTGLLCEALAARPQPPRVLVCASAVGIYGDRGDEVCTEDSAPGPGFLADVTRAWEAACAPASAAGVRVVNLRIGMVLSGTGGALGAMRLPFLLGLGGRVGSGTQYVSWVALEDLVGAIHAALSDDSLRGPVNAVAPRPVTNLQFTKALGRVLRRPTVLPVPAFAVRALFGQMGRELLLASTRVEPRRLQAAAFDFRHPGIDAALRHVLRGAG